MKKHDYSQSPRSRDLLEQGYCSIEKERPGEHLCVDYDLLFLGQRVTGRRTLAGVALEVDGALNLVDAALLLGSGPGVESAYWRPHDPTGSPEKAESNGELPLSSHASTR